MSTLYFNLIILLAAICFWNCSETGTEQEDLNDAELNIHFGSFGSLCGFSDSLSIFSNLDTHFDLREFCTDTDFETSQSIEQSEYEALISSFSLSAFRSLNNDSCERCLDGIDHFLFIVGSDFSHRIVYSTVDNIEPMQALVTQLETIREAHQPQ